jgi:hypothetical protein
MYPKYQKPLCIILTFVVCFVMFTGCSPKEKVQSSASPSASASQNIKEILTEKTEEYEGDDPNKLTVYFSDTLGMMTNVILTAGPKKGILPVPDVLNSKIFNDVEEMETELVPELLAGGGPDIFIFDNRILPNFKNYMKQGLFVDLNELISNDTAADKLDLSQYNQTVLEVGQWEGKQYFIPIGFRPAFFYTTQELCDQYGITIPEDGISYSEMPTVFQNFIEQETGKKALVSTESLLKDRAYQYIDMPNESCTFDSEAFKSEIETYDVLTTISLEQYSNQGGPPSRKEGVLTGDIFCAYEISIDSGMANITKYYNDCITAKQTPVIFGLKDEKTGGYVAHTTLCFAINTNSPKRELALSYLKGLLDKSVQGYLKDDTFDYSFGIPLMDGVRKDVVEAIIYKAQQFFIERTPEAEVFVNKYIEIVNNITSCYMVDGKWEEQIFLPARREYDAGKTTADQFAQTLQQKTNIFLKE